MFKRILRITVWSALGVLFALPASLTTAVFADPPAVGNDRPSAPQSGYGVQASTSNSRFLHYSSPNGCIMGISELHRSTHEPTRMNGSIIAECASAVDYMSHRAQVWEKMSQSHSSWIRVGISGTFNKAFRYSGKAHANTFCRISRYGFQLTGEGYVIVDGRRYYTTLPVGGEILPNPCNL